jgi:acetylornithine deacetylase
MEFHVQGRGNILVEYPGTGDGIMSFVGMHLDVVPANPEAWAFGALCLVTCGVSTLEVIAYR